MTTLQGDSQWDKSSDLTVLPTEIPIGPIQLAAREQRSWVMSSMEAKLLGPGLGREGERDSWVRRGETRQNTITVGKNGKRVKLCLAR